MGRAQNLFEASLSAGDKIAEGFWKVTTAKRRTLVPPAGFMLYDTDLKQIFIGDGTLNGGYPAHAKKRVRLVNVAAASSGITVATSGATTNANTLTWAPAAYLRTGDAVTLAAGGGAVPSGTSATTYWIFKPSDVGDGKANTSTVFKLATTRENALAKTGVTLYSAGTAGFTSVIAGVMASDTADVTLISPVSAAIDVYLPYSNNSDGFTCTVSRAATATNAVTIKEVDVSGNAKASGAMTVDGAAGYVSLRASNADFCEFFADATNGVYYTAGKRIA